MPVQEQARRAIWRAVDPHKGIRRIDIAFPQAQREKTLDQEMLIQFKNGSTWQVLGLDNFNSLVGSPPCGIVFSEWPLSDPGEDTQRVLRAIRDGDVSATRRGTGTIARAARTRAVRRQSHLDG